MSDFLKNFLEIQKKLKVGKTRQSIQYGYKYRTAEDILAKAKPLLNEAGMILSTPSHIYDVGNRPFVEVHAIVKDTETGEEISASAAVAIQMNTIGKNLCQDSGAATSYAKKYALGNLFSIDDGIDVENINDDITPSLSELNETTEPTKNDGVNPLSTPLMSLDEAFAVVADLGMSSGHTLKEIYERQPQNLFWLLKNGSSCAAAIKIIISSDPKLVAQCERKQASEEKG